MTDKVLTKTTSIEDQGWKLTSVLIDLNEKKMVETWQVPPPERPSALRRPSDDEHSRKRSRSPPPPKTFSPKTPP